MSKSFAAVAVALAAATGCSMLTLPDSTDLRLLVAATDTIGGELDAVFHNTSRHEIGVGMLSCASRIEREQNGAWYTVSRWPEIQTCPLPLYLIPPRGMYPFHTPAPSIPGTYRLKVEARYQRGGVGSGGMSRDLLLTVYSEPFTVTAP